MKILSAEQIKFWDQYTIDHEPISSLNLMERAAQQCTNWIIENFHSSTSFKIFCGKGNNGGDGIAIARQLVDKNIFAEVYILDTGAEGTKEFLHNLFRLKETTVKINLLKTVSDFPTISSTDVVIDALYGTGLNRPLSQLSAHLVNHINKSNPTTISIDIPSGLFVDQSSLQNPVIKANHILTFEVLKLSFLMAENEVFFGRITILPIGLSPMFLRKIVTPYIITVKEYINKIYKPRKPHSHKGTFGHALIIAGDEGKIGAAVLAAKACLRAGAGLVTALLQKEHYPIMQVAAPEVMCADRNSKIDVQKFASVGIGPGLGASDKATRLLENVIIQSKRPMVIDADGINILSLNPALIYKVPAFSIITPHQKEFERLFGKQANDFERLKTAQVKAKEHNIIIVLKGHLTAIVCPDKIYFNNTGNAGMATAGSGDVLTGIITGFLATGYSSLDAALLGVYLHGSAGDLAATSLSQEALIASDLVSYLGKAFLNLQQ